MYVPDIGETIEPYILDSTPNVLSVGYRCQERGWGFYWEPWSSRPRFVSPSGKSYPLSTDGHIPYLTTRNPAVASVPTTSVGGAESTANRNPNNTAQVSGAERTANWRMSYKNIDFF